MGIHMQDIYHVFSDLNIQSDKTKLQKVKTQLITTSVERGETSYDPTILTKPAVGVKTGGSRVGGPELCV